MYEYGLHTHQSISCPNSVTGEAGVFFLALINTLFTNQCQLGNKENYPEDFGPSLNENDVFDYIIVGGGTSGSVLASHLAKNTDNKILLLEAGAYSSPTSDIPAFHLSLQKTPEDWQFHTEPNNNSCLGYKHGRCYLPSGKVLGGSSTINSMLYLRGNKHIFNTWAEAGRIGWSYHDLLPHFNKLEKLEAHDLINSKDYGHGGKLPLTKNRFHQPIRNVILDSVKELGYKVYSHEPSLGFFEALQYIKEGVRKNSAKVFLADHQILPNLKLATEAFVEKIIIDKELREANGIKVNIAGKQMNLYADKEIIISAGAINSPKLLMLSGVGPKEHLGSLGIETVHDLQVGQNLQDSVMYPIFAVKVNHTAAKYLNQDPSTELFKYFSNREGTLANTNLGNIVGLINTNKKATDIANIKLNYMFIPQEDSYVLSELKKVSDLNEKTFHSLVEANRESHLVLISITLLKVRSKGKMLLRSKNPHEKPLLYPGYLSDEKDLEDLLKGIKIAEKQIETTNFKKLSAQLVGLEIPNCEKYKMRSDEYWRCAIRNLATTGYSLTSTCPMGLSFNEESVVDPLFRVHGMGKLRVVDSSVFPSTTGGDLSAAAFMIGQKAADILTNNAIKSHLRN